MKKSKGKNTGNKIKNMKKIPASIEMTGGTSDDEKDAELESFLFGTIKEVKQLNQDAINTFDEDDNNMVGSDEQQPEQELLSFAISTKPNEDIFFEDVHLLKSTDQHFDKSIEVIKLKESNKERVPAWVDPDDEDIKVNFEAKKKRKLKAERNEKEVSGVTFQKRLKSQYEKLLAAPVWADLSEIDEENNKQIEDEDDLTKTTSNLLKSTGFLQKSILTITRQRNINKQEPSNMAITSVKFHPSAKVAFTASLNQRLSIFQTDGKDNPKLQSIFFESFPIFNAHFGNGGDKIYMSSRMRFFYVYDIQGGGISKVFLKGKNDGLMGDFQMSPDGETMALLRQDGYINMVSTKNCQLMHNLKMNGSVKALSFSEDSSTLYSTGGDGEVYIWDLKMRRCRQRFVDDGSFCGSALTRSPNGKFVAAGSSSGVVNVYEDSKLTMKYPKPSKILMNLTTRIGGMKFNSSSEILAYYSAEVRNGIKLVHFPSLTVFSNWPAEKQTLGNITSIDFSPLSGYLGIGNKKGDALMFRLAHYPDA